MARARSYICERSAEYVLVPELVNELRKTIKFVTALYPWASRESSKISVEVNESKSFKVLGVYISRNFSCDVSRETL